MAADHQDFLIEESLHEPFDFPGEAAVEELYPRELRNFGDFPNREKDLQENELPAVVLSPEDVTAARLRNDPAILDAFIYRQKFVWGHQAWLELLEELTHSGATPFNPDQIGLLLETRREELRQK